MAGIEPATLDLNSQSGAFDYPPTEIPKIVTVIIIILCSIDTLDVKIHRCPVIVISIDLLFNNIVFKVPIWTVEDVAKWVIEIEFQDYLKNFIESGVDGDLLLQLDEANIKEDLKIKNGIHRKRFVRELDKLKKQADFSSCDKHGIAMFLQDHPQLGEDFRIYTYGLVINGLSIDLMRRLSSSNLDDTLKEAGVNNPVHRQRIMDAVLVDLLLIDECDDVCPLDIAVDLVQDPMYDAFICNASPLSHGSGELASLIEFNLKQHGLTTIRFGESANNPNAERSSVIKRCKNFVLVLTKGALDIHNENPRMKIAMKIVHNDLLAALSSHDCKIIPVFDPDFQFPDPEDIPEDIRQVCSFNAIRWVHEYQDACIEKLERFIKGEPGPSLKQSLTYSNRLHYSTPSFLTVNHGMMYGSRSRNESGRSTPTRFTHRFHSPPNMSLWPSSLFINTNSVDKNKRRNVSVDCLLGP